MVLSICFQWPVSVGAPKNQKALPQVRQGFLVPSLFDIGTYERCSLTTVGVVTGATTNMYS